MLERTDLGAAAPAPGAAGPRPPLLVVTDALAAERTASFWLGDGEVVARAWPGWLEPFRRPDVGGAPEVGAARAERQPPVGPPIFSGDAWLFDGLRAVEVRSARDGIAVAVPGLASYLATAERVELVACDLAPEVRSAALDVLFGSIVLLSFALRHVFALHAAVVATPAGPIAFAGESGQGKSTLAAAAAARGWDRLADDLVLVALGAEGVTALPRFPQLKLSVGEQYPLSAPTRRPLAALYLLAPAAAAVAVEGLSQRAATAGLVAQTVAARFFPPALLEAHLDLSARAVGALPVRRLAFPRRLDALPQMLAAVRDDLVGGTR